jgi:hypothetical protein
MLTCDYFSGFWLGSEGVSEYQLIRILNLKGLSVGPFIGYRLLIVQAESVPFHPTLSNTLPSDFLKIKDPYPYLIA